MAVRELARVLRMLEKQLPQAILAIPDGLAVDLDHVAEGLRPVPLRFHQQEVGRDVARLLHPAIRSKQLLRLLLFGDDGGEGIDVGRDVLARLADERRRRLALGRGSRGDEHTDAGEDDERLAQRDPPCEQHNATPAPSDVPHEPVSARARSSASSPSLVDDAESRIRGWMRLAGLLFAALGAALPAFAQAPDWKAVETEALKTLQSYVRINTSNPPGDVAKAADFLQDLLKREGIDVTRYESAPGRSILLARLKGDGTGGKAILLESHMDVVPTDPSRWKEDPFGAQNRRRQGVGPRHDRHERHRHDVSLCVPAAASFEGAAEARRDPAVRARRRERRRHGSQVDAREPLRRARSEYVIDEGGFGSRDMFTREAGLRHFGGREADHVAAAARRGCRGHGSQPHDKNPERAPDGALGRLFAQPPRRAVPGRRDDEAARRRSADGEQVQQRDPEVHDLADEPAFRCRRSARGPT
jgi:hypothetical protein